MSDDRYRRLEELFDRALDLDSSEREAFLDCECGDDMDLRREVNVLLAANDDTPPHPLTSSGDASAEGATHTVETAQRVVGDRYRIVRLIGQGGLGSVFEAFDPILQRQVAIKVLGRLHGIALARFMREARAMARMTDPSLLTIHDIGATDRGSPYLVMELIDGGSLTDWLLRRPPLEPSVALEIIRQVAQGLVVLDRHGIVHRDIKPGNILIATSGRVLLGDFGLARVYRGRRHRAWSESRLQDIDSSAVDLNDELTADGVLLGTPAYAAPEQFLGGDTDARSDLYSLGIVFYELLTGTRPFSGGSPEETILRRVSQTPPTLRQVVPDIPADLDDIVIRLLAPDPDSRYQSARQLLDALDHLAIHPGGVKPDDARFQEWLSRGQPPQASSGPPSISATTMQALPLPWLTAGEDHAAGAWLMDLEADRQHRVQGESLIGRARDCQVRLDSQFVSDRQFIVHEVGDEFHLLNMADGTLINGEWLEPGSELRLRDRDLIQVGGISMLFVHRVASEREAIAQRQLRLFDDLWQRRNASESGDPAASLDDFARHLVHDILREALGYHVECEIPAYHGITGHVVEAPMLWIRQTRFPILVFPFSDSLVLDDIIAQLQAARATDFLALLVVLPPEEPSGNEVRHVRQLVDGSVYRHDLVVLGRAELTRIVRSGGSKALVDILVEQGVELSRLSPYVIRGPVPTSMFFGREAEIKQLSQKPCNHAVVGGRRMGKSSILLRLNYLLNRDPRFRAFYLNCEACFDDSDFLATFSDSLQTPQTIEKVIQIRPCLTHIAKQYPGRVTVFLLDEVDELISFDATSRARGRLFKTLRALSHEQLGYFIFSGGRTLHDALHDPHSPFFNFCDDICLYPLSRPSVAEIITKPMRQLSIELADEEAVIGRIFAITSGHPNLVQYLCHRLVSRDRERRITPVMVDDVIHGEEFVQHFVETAWSQATPLEKLISLLPDSVEFSLEWLLEQLGDLGVTSRQAIDSAMRTLELYALIQTEGDTCRFVLTHFPEAVRRLDLAAQISAQVSELEEL